MTTALPSTAEFDVGATTPTIQTRRVITAAVIGNGLIVYDFTVYSFSAVIIAKLFFPFSTPHASLLMVFATFGAGFFMRPLGAMIIGNLADRKGRKAGLTFSIAMMTLGTGIIAFTPSYASIGIAAPLLIVLARLMQGLAAGGEIGVASTVLMESAPKERRCSLVSWRAASQGASALFGALVGVCTTAAFTPETMESWGWRTPFVLGLLIGPVGWYIRYHMTETLKVKKNNSVFKQVFVQHPRTLIFGILSMAGPSASIYIMVFYMPTYLITTTDISPTISLLSSCFAGAIIFIFTLLLGPIADRRRERKSIQRYLLLSCIVVVYPAFLVLTHEVGEVVSLLVIVAYCAMALNNGGGAHTVMMLEAFPPQHRAAGMSMIYSFGATIFGGFSPFIVTWLIGITGDPMAPAWYLLVALGISLLALNRFPGPISDELASPVHAES